MSNSKKKEATNIELTNNELQGVRMGIEQLTKLSKDNENYLPFSLIGKVGVLAKSITQPLEVVQETQQLARKKFGEPAYVEGGVQYTEEGKMFNAQKKSKDGKLVKEQVGFNILPENVEEFNKEMKELGNDKITLNAFSRITLSSLSKVKIGKNKRPISVDVITLLMPVLELDIDLDSFVDEESVETKEEK